MSRYGAGVTVRKNVALSAFTTFGVGGPARELSEPSTADQIVEDIRSADERSLALFVLGGGSNVVISDEGFDGVVVRLNNVGISFNANDDSDQVQVTVEAGTPWDELVRACLAENLSGLETMSGIPGSCGGATVQNIGAYGAEISALVESVDVYDRDADRVSTFDAKSCDFEYRNSIFKHQSRYVVLRTRLRLTRSDMSIPIVYAELARRLNVEVGESRLLSDVRSAVLELRAGKGMVVDPDDHDSRSAGSFFTNPIVDRKTFEQLCRATDTTPPSWPSGDDVKVSAAWLIGRAGFEKGMRHNGAGISTKHTLAIVNADGATTADVVELAQRIRHGVASQFGIDLQPEPVLVGVNI